MDVQRWEPQDPDRSQLVREQDGMPVRVAGPARVVPAQLAEPEGWLSVGPVSMSRRAGAGGMAGDAPLMWREVAGMVALLVRLVVLLSIAAPVVVVAWRVVGWVA